MKGLKGPFCLFLKGKWYIIGIVEEVETMRIYTLKIDEREAAAVEKNGKLYPITNCKDMSDVIEKGTESLELGMPLEFGDAKILAPIPHPKQDLICLGVNYEEHREESSTGIGMTKDSANIYFSKRAAKASGDGDEIPLYDFVDSTDYEAELGVIIGKSAKNVNREDALSYVFGYTVINDVSARNLQKKHSQFYFAKSLDGYTVMGPCIVTADEIADPQNLDIWCRVNGEFRQKSNTGNMICDIAGIIEELSMGIELLPGTIISTGTPAGTGMGMDPPGFLHEGDICECGIEKIGSIKNVCRQK